MRGGLVELEIHGEGPPLVLLHGWALDRRIWESQLKALSSSFQLIVPDRRGFGRSSAPPNLALEVDDLVVIRRKLGLDSIGIVAMSQAGRVALQFALAHPESVWGLVLQGAPLDGFHPDERSRDAVPIESYRALARLGQLEEVRRQWDAHPLARLPAELHRVLAPLIGDYEGRDLYAPVSPALVSIAEHLADIWVPALVVTGEYDTPWRQLVGDALAYGLGNARRAVILGAYHLCNVSSAEEFNSLVTRFLLRVREGSRAPATSSAA